MQIEPSPTLDGSVMQDWPTVKERLGLADSPITTWIREKSAELSSIPGMKNYSVPERSFRSEREN
jgi:hypothetical protein